MKRHVLMTLPLLSTFISSFALADTIVLKADSWCPYTCGAKDEKPGYMIEMAKAIFEAKGHTVKFENQPWARTLVEARTGAVVAAGTTESDAEGLILGGNFGASNNCVFAPKGSGWKYAGIESLKGKILGVIIDYTYGEPFDAHIKANKANSKLISEATGEDAAESNFKKLAAKRLDAVVEDGNVAAMTLLKVGKSADVENIGCENAQKLSMGFNKTNPKSADYAKMLDKGVDELRTSGKLKTILAKYGVKDWK
jgi:polar amino acid transport system substrate-binding protein